MNNQFVILALLGLISVNAMPVYRLANQGYLGDGDLSYQNGDPNQWWGLGNAQGSEKLDGTWHAAHNTADTPAFDKAMAKNHYNIPSDSHGDAEPTTQYPRSMNALVQRDMGQMPTGTVFNYYADGKGAGSEKQDSFWDIAHQAKDSAAFDKTAATFPGISAGNQFDAVPTTQYHNNNGFVQMMTPPPADAFRPSVYPDREMGQMVKDPVFKYYTNGNGAGSEKQDWAWDIAHQAKDTEQFHKQAAYFPGIDSDNSKHGAPSTQYFNNDVTGASLSQMMAPPAPDAWRPSVYPDREMHQMVVAPIFKYYTNGNGAGSEKHDFVNDIARETKDTEAFDKSAAYFPGINSDNSKQGKPENTYFNGEAAGASL